MTSGRAAWLNVAQPIAHVPGLRWKVWLMNEAVGRRLPLCVTVAVA